MKKMFKNKVMGILNITPDSFYDGGKYINLNDALKKTESMIYEGVDIIDIGGESTKPGFKFVTEEEEYSRVIPFFEKIKKIYPKIYTSINTSSHRIIKKCINLGVNIINDVRFKYKKDIIESSVLNNVYLCVVHTGKNLHEINIRKNKNIIKELDVFFANKINKLCRLGFNRENIIIDPGFGYGKSFEENYYILKNLNYFKKFRLPILAGISNKSMLKNLVNNFSKYEDLCNIVASTILLIKGANIIRVHEIKKNKNILKIIKKIFKR
ncbi:MAG: dihydropteroate synthase [Enterobacteriaceae bacterium]